MLPRFVDMETQASGQLKFEMPHPQIILLSITFPAATSVKPYDGLGSVIL